MKWVALGAWLLACPGERAQPAKRPAGLKVPLPDEWRALPDGEVLHVTAQGREVMTLTMQEDAPLPSTDALEASVAKGGGESLGALALPDGVLLRFRVAQGAEGVLGVRRLAGRTLLCASEPQAQQSELKKVAQMCSDTEWAK